MLARQREGRSNRIPNAIYTGAAPMPVLDYTELVEKSARSALRDEAVRHEGKGVEVETLFKIGVAWKEIVGAAVQFDVGLIVMGTHGRRCLPRVIMGSVAEKVVRLSPVPVLTIHPSDARL
jgi:nucleotide-binding universal stress UspA family protein